MKIYHTLMNIHLEFGEKSFILKPYLLFSSSFLKFLKEDFGGKLVMDFGSWDYEVYGLVNDLKILI